MGYPLTDITFYFDGYVVNVREKDNPYSTLSNYIADLYYANLNGYKPPKTGRICLHLVPNKLALFPSSYFGSILSCYAMLPEEDLISKNKEELRLLFLNVLHEMALSSSKKFSWDEAVFVNAYARCLDNDLQYIKEYPANRSRNRLVSASAVVKKDLQTTYTYIRVVSGNADVLHKVFETVNYGCHDVMYGLSTMAKWIDSDRFGFALAANNVDIFYSVKEDAVRAIVNNAESLEEKEKLFIRATTERTDINPFYLTYLYHAKRANLKEIWQMPEL